VVHPVRIAGVKRLADGVWQLKGVPPNAINAYLIEDVLIDAATRRAGRRILRQLDGQRVRAHALTHAHADHQGASNEVCEKLGLPYWVGEVDAPMAENPDLMRGTTPPHPLPKLMFRFWAGPGRPGARRRSQAGEVAGFRVIDVPGHSAGHVAYWRESDRVLVIGDVLTNVDVLTGRTGLHEPKPNFTADPRTNRESARKLAPLEPKLVLFGHGPPLRDPKKFVDFVTSLPA
jgi:hydroxyacylglutathione hydrolase